MTISRFLAEDAHHFPTNKMVWAQAFGTLIAQLFQFRKFCAQGNTLINAHRAREAVITNRHHKYRVRQCEWPSPSAASA